MRDYFNRGIDEPLLYDAVWNTEKPPMEAITSSIITLIRQRVSAAAVTFMAP